MNGVVNILKPPDMTSHDVVYAVRRIFGTKKVGHTGTLDPEAVGVLPVLVGKATKLCDLMTASQKKYRAVLHLGLTTDTEDIWGEVLTRTEVNVDALKLETVLNQFIGEIDQVPPMYSAVKIDGKKLYQLAREGKVIEREARKITIYGIKMLHYSEGKALIEVDCSKGTFIRTLCQDIGQTLGTGGTMGLLLRTQSGSFTIENSVTLEELVLAKEDGSLEQFLLPIMTLLQEFPKVFITQEEEKRVRNGGKLPFRLFPYSGQNCQLMSPSGELLALYEAFSDGETKGLRSLKTFF